MWIRGIALAIGLSLGNGVSAQGAGELIQQGGRFLVAPDAFLRDAILNEPGLGDLLRGVEGLDRRLSAIAAGQLTAAQVGAMLTDQAAAASVRERLIAVKGAGLRVEACPEPTAACMETYREVARQLDVLASELASMSPSDEQVIALELARRVHLAVLNDDPGARSAQAARYQQYFAAALSGFDAEIAAVSAEIDGWFEEPGVAARTEGLSGLVALAGPQIIVRAMGRVTGSTRMRFHGAAYLAPGTVMVVHSCGVERVWRVGQLEIDGVARREIGLSDWVSEPGAFAEAPARGGADVRFVWEQVTLQAAEGGLIVGVGWGVSPEQDYRDGAVRQHMAEVLPAAAQFEPSECVYRGRTSIGGREQGMENFRIALQREVDALAAQVARLDSLRSMRTQVAARS